MSEATTADPLRPVYLSFGGGVNSVALMLWLRDQGREFETVYADHGCDWPETREYVANLRAKGYPITVLETRRNNLTLLEWCLKYRIMPDLRQRWCTEEFKVKPIRGYIQQPCTVYLAIAAEEAHRCKPSGNEDIEHQFPLIEEGIDRAECRHIIEAHGLPVPPKSTCYFCPMQSGKDIVRLRTVHPDLFCKVQQMEQALNERRAGKKPYYLYRKPVAQVAQSDQLDLFGERTQCMCGL